MTRVVLRRLWICCVALPALTAALNVASAFAWQRSGTKSPDWQGYVVGERSRTARPTEEAAVAKVIRDSISWALTKDRALQESTMAHDPDLFYFWTDSDTPVVGWEQHVKLFDLWMGPRFKATLTEVRDLRVNFSHGGDVAWYSAMLDDLGELDGRPVGNRNIRWTGVLEKRDGRWVIVQMHASLAAASARAQATPAKQTN